MKDKQVMIDGVDVSGCKKYEHEIVRCNATLRNMCFCGGRCTDKKNEDCYYKQLIREKQKCEKLKQTLTEIKPILKIYAHSKIYGEKQMDGTYKITVKN